MTVSPTSPAGDSRAPERPILFSGPMVRAILDGKKTQTRRVVKAPRADFATLKNAVATSWDQRAAGIRAQHPGATDETIGYLLGKRTHGMHLLCNRVNDDGIHSLHCPHGAPGDRLWVRETLTRSGGCIQYAADYKTSRFPWPVPEWKQDPRPSIHMPRWASRLSLEITNVRVERLRDISEDDAKAEGIDTSVVDPSPRGVAPIKAKNYVYARDCFTDLWNRLNYDRGFGWDVNPWVWALTFRVIEDRP